MRHEEKAEKDTPETNIRDKMINDISRNKPKKPQWKQWKQWKQMEA